MTYQKARWKLYPTKSSLTTAGKKYPSLKKLKVIKHTSPKKGKTEYSFSD